VNEDGSGIFSRHKGAEKAELQRKTSKKIKSVAKRNFLIAKLYPTLKKIVINGKMEE